VTPIVETPASPLEVGRRGPERGSIPALGWMLFVGSGIASQVAAALATKTYDDVGAAAGACLTFSLAGILLFGLRRPSTRGWPRERWRDSVGFGAIIVVNAVVVYMALEYLPLGTTVTIEFLGPLAVAVFHAKQARDYLIALCAIGGVALVSAASVSTSPAGISLALVGAACWAIYIFASRRAGSYARPADSLVIAIAAGGLLSIPLAVVGAAEIGETRTLLLLVAVAVIGRILPYAFEIAALQIVTLGSAGILFSIVPAIAALTGFVLLGQSFSALQSVGLAVVILAGALVIHDSETA
jgi:inner membrane transporter RhtA